MILAPGECSMRDWVKESGMSGRAQSMLVAALRGADADDSPEVKRLVRWVRKHVLKDVSPRSHFMRDYEFVSVKALMKQDSWQWDRLSAHFYDHLKQALAIIAAFHPDEWAAAKAQEAFNDMTSHEDIVPESKAELIGRLRDESPIARGEWVVQDWVLQLGGRLQNCLFCSLRGSDITTDKEVRRVTHWLRSIVMKNAMPSSHYMADKEFMSIANYNEMHPSAWGNLPIHFRHHTREALEAVAYCHPDADVRQRALQAYTDLAIRSKGKPEDKDTFLKRMGDEPGRAPEAVRQQTNLPVG